MGRRKSRGLPGRRMGAAAGRLAGRQPAACQITNHPLGGPTKARCCSSTGFTPASHLAQYALPKSILLSVVVAHYAMPVYHYHYCTSVRLLLWRGVVNGLHHRLPRLAQHGRALYRERWRPSPGTAARPSRPGRRAVDGSPSRQPPDKPASTKQPPIFAHQP